MRLELTPKSLLSQKRVEYLLRVRGELLLKMEELEHFRVLFTSERRVER